MYVIKFDQNEVYAGTYQDMEGSYLYSSNFNSKIKPRVFKTLKGVQNHLNKLWNKIPYPDGSDLRIEIWSEEDYQNHLILIGLDYSKEKARIEENKKEKYWKKVFKPIKGEVEVKKIKVKDDVGILLYLMPYSSYEYEFIFNANDTSENVIDSFCDTVQQEGAVMRETIYQNTHNIREMFKT